LIFRKDVNGLRAIAVIAVLLFHFKATWLPGGFAGVDVFFVISGFLMTGIIFRGIEQENFSILKFYIARVNRIIPALAVLCLVLLILGWFFLAPLDYKTLGKHVGSSMAFLSNFVYWNESGYFTASSHSKWLLHTWSVATEWQFYIVYPLILLSMRKFMTIKEMKRSILFITLLGFILCIILTFKWPNSSYYLLPARAWEMMVGGLAYLYPLELKKKRKKLVEWLGLILILGSYLFFSKDYSWPGSFAIFPVLGSFLIIQAHNNDSIITCNTFFQKVGAWSYSIYLWHWPLVVTIYYFSLNSKFTYLCIFISIFLGFLSYKYIEKIKFTNSFYKLSDYLKCKPIYMFLFISMAGSIIFIEKGFIAFASSEYKNLINTARPSPYRDKCHIAEYKDPRLSCEYFGNKVSWATFGDSHSVEIAYALAETLKRDNIGLKHFSFSGCIPSYKETEAFSKCSKWFNETVNYILNDKNIKNVVFNHRFTWDFFGGNAHDYPNSSKSKSLTEVQMARVTKHIDDLISEFAKNKENVFIFYPIPELPRDIDKLIGLVYKNDGNLVNIPGTSLKWYEERNRYIINHFNTAHFPSNVYLLNPKDIFCDQNNCLAVKDGTPLYFDDNHVSTLGAAKLVELIKL